MSDLQPIKPGHKYEVPYPFHFSKTTIWGEDSDSDIVVDNWTPGTFAEHITPDDCGLYAHAMGLMCLRVVSLHEPGKPYHPRVFYVRTWQAPNGRTFGKTHLRMTTVQAFKRMLKGYRHPFEIEPIESKGAES